MYGIFKTEMLFLLLLSACIECARMSETNRHHGLTKNKFGHGSMRNSSSDSDQINGFQALDVVWLDYKKLTAITYVAQRAQNCNQIISSEIISITSPDYPRNYSANMDCTYIIQKSSPDVCGFWFGFQNFELEWDPECQHDYFEVKGQRYCGGGPSDTVELSFDEEEIIIKFHSDGSHSGSGFSMIAHQKPDCPAANAQNCDKWISEETFSIKSPNYPRNYTSNLDCTYTIRKSSPDICKLRFTKRGFKLQKGRYCEHDYLEVNGFRYCGQQWADIVGQPFDKELFVIKFHSDASISDKGFYITGLQQTGCRNVEKHTNNCDKDISSEMFSIKSPNYPENYSPNTDCVYMIKSFARSDVCKLSLTFVRFELEYSLRCEYDYLEVNSQRYCGYGPDDVILLDFQGPWDILIKFHSDQSVQDHGFHIEGQQITNC